METLLFGAASGLAALWFGVHVFVGGREIARPLLETGELRPVVKHTQYLCWHFTTVAIACIVAFFCIAVFTGITAYAISATALAIGFFLTGVGLVVALGESHSKLPQGWLFLPVALLGIAGLLW